MKHVCKNCGNSFIDNYCNHCGQKFDVPRFTFKHIFEESFHAFTHADKSIITFVRMMFFSPGKLAYEYIIERKRKRYFNPFTFFLLIIAINAFVESFDLDLKEKLFNTNDEYGHIFNIYSKVFSLAFIPILAFTIWLLYLRKRKLLFSEYTVFAMILFSLFSMIETIVHAINYCFTALLHTYVSVQDNIVYLVLMIGYITYADYQLHTKTQSASWFKSLLTGILFCVLLVGVQIFTVYAIINKFHGLGQFYTYGIKLS